jgi:hypothetical protein
MEIDLPEVVAEVKAAFERYERALVTNDVKVVDELFHDDPRTIRYGGGENLYGFQEIAAFRAARPSAGLARTLSRTVISTYGRDFAVASTLYDRPSFPGKIGRQQQTWVRFPQGWRVVAAHVSMIDEDQNAKKA